MNDRVAIFRQRLYQTRTRRGMTQAQLADKSLVPLVCISRYERGLMEPGLTNLIALADALSVTLDYLTALTDDINTKGTTNK